MCIAGFYVTPIIPFFYVGSFMQSHIPKGNLLGRLCKSITQWQMKSKQKRDIAGNQNMREHGLYFYYVNLEVFLRYCHFSILIF